MIKADLFFDALVKGKYFTKPWKRYDLESGYYFVEIVCENCSVTHYFPIKVKVEHYEHFISENAVINFCDKHNISLESLECLKSLH